MGQQRPISPHLGIYRREWTMIYSILHRATGLGLVCGLIALVLWLGALAWGGEVFAFAQGLVGSAVGRVILLLTSWSLAYHLCNGIRHLCWDFGLGFELEQARKSGNLVAIASVLLTFLVWALGYGLIG